MVVKGVYYVPGIVSTIGLFMYYQRFIGPDLNFRVNAVAWSDLDNSFGFSDGVSAKAKLWMVIAFMISFGGLIGNHF
jgi:hypothetical protein